MHKPPRRMHTSTRRFPLSRRSPSKPRAFLGVFNITKGFGRHGKCQRPRISLQIKRCQPITPPIIRRKHREIPIFRPRPVCRGLRLQNTRKNARRHHPPHGANQNKSAVNRPRTIFIQINYCPYNSDEPQGGEQVPSRRIPQDARSPRRTKCAARASCMSEDAPGGNLLSARTGKTNYATV